MNVQALVTERVAADTGVHAVPFLGPLAGQDMLRAHYPGARPIVRGERSTRPPPMVTTP